MKKILRHYVIETYSLYLVSTIAAGMIFSNGIPTLLLTGLAFMGASFLAKPAINIMLLPLNLVTFGFFRWVSSALVLYLVTLIVPTFSIVGFGFPGYFSKWIEIPALNFSGVVAYVAYAFILSIITSVLYWLFK